MEPGTITLALAVTFSVLLIGAVFIRQWVLNYNKNLNQEMQRKNRDQEAAQLEQVRDQALDNRRFASHYKILNEHKEEVCILDKKIQEVLNKKEQLILRYQALPLPEPNDARTRLKEELDNEMAYYSNELQTLQARRIALWQRSEALQAEIIQQEQLRNTSLDALYATHTQVIENIHLRHSDATQALEKEIINAGTEDLKSAFMAPVNLLFRFFNVPQIIPVPVVSIQSRMNHEPQSEGLMSSSPDAGEDEGADASDRQWNEAAFTA
ncbi:MAG: hypothetical protein CK426_02680 [Legionella sp.]|nr:MAG: hypothetical protein CK423_08535 [Legionella sp.]PJD99437.1 MAG: hypothetical protein CK426_02680 [Legionella sp.]